MASAVFVFILNGIVLPASVKPDKDGFIRDGLICGPFPNPGSHNETKTRPGLETDWLEKDSGEACINPKPGMYYEASIPDVKCKNAKNEEYQPWDSGEIEVEWRRFFSAESRINLLE